MADETPQPTIPELKRALIERLESAMDLVLSLPDEPVEPDQILGPSPRNE